MIYTSKPLTFIGKLRENKSYYEFNFLDNWSYDAQSVGILLLDDKTNENNSVV